MNWKLRKAVPDAPYQNTLNLTGACNSTILPQKPDLPVIRFFYFDQLILLTPAKPGHMSGHMFKANYTMTGQTLAVCT
jgi:hypothetical protein